MDDPADGAIEAIQSRFEMVELLRTAPHRKPELEAELAVSRSTIDRAVGELEAADLVTRTADGYRATAYAGLLADRYAAFLETAADVADAAPLLEALPRGASVSPALLAGATVTRSEAPLPNRPIDRYEELLYGADRIRGVSRAISQSTTPDVVRDRVVEERMESELVLDRTLVEYLRREGRDRHREMLETGRHALYEHPDVPYGLELLEDGGDACVVVFVYGESGELLGTVANDSPDAVAWATGVFERYREEATDVSKAFLEDEEADRRDGR